MIGDYFDRKGNPISDEQYLLLLKDKGSKRVAETTCGAYWVSTVWLGIDHSSIPSGPPLIFETMVERKGDGGGGWMGWQARYSTEEEALAGHAEAVRRYSLPDEVRDATDRLRGDHFDSGVFPIIAHQGKNEGTAGKE